VGTLDIVVGGQFGSEAKGHVTAQVIDRIRIECTCGADIINVRVAGPNAGHCVIDDNGQKWAMRSIPVGFVYPDVVLHIAAGSEIDMGVLIDEVEQAEAAGHKIRGRLSIHQEATVLTQQHKALESPDHADLHRRIGSTGKGIGAARADRIMRQALRVMDDADVMAKLADMGIAVHDRPVPTHAHVVIEGTQGFGLGLHAGHYPQCTSSNTRAIDFAAMAGVAPWEFDDFVIWLVARVFPIRVAGNSGPLKGETTWDALGLPEELTTVTKKVRRVGEWDGDLVRAAVTANGRSRVLIALTMLDQKFPEIANVTTEMVKENDYGLVLDGVWSYVDQIERDAGAPVRMLTTGESTAVWVR
jgi:adenylosuccinate synthase